ncbi:MAG: YraN family protein [Rikenellaceae bacterium]
MAGLATRIGAAGEHAAMQWLRQRGYMIRDLNWRAGSYELDIVAERYGVVHFVEVKSRKTGSWTTPEQAMTQSKQQSLIKAARSYIAQYHINSEFQFDLVAVEINPDLTFDIRLRERVIDIRW